jgi:hypothetical protein
MLIIVILSVIMLSVVTFSLFILVMLSVAMLNAVVPTLKRYLSLFIISWRVFNSNMATRTLPDVQPSLQYNV